MSRTNCAIGKDYVPASFKGVMFMCIEADIEGGRRGAEGEFPFGEHTAYADLGRKIRVFHLTAVFREDDHVAHASALFAVCESPGPGMLVHPTKGTHMAACRSVKVKDKVEEEQGQTHAELEFVEANVAGLALGGFGGLGALGGAINLFGIISTNLNAESSAVFRANYRVTQTSQPWRSEVINTTQKLVTSVVKVTEQALTVNSALNEWRSLLKIKEVATDPGLASQADKVDDALQSGFSMISANVQAPDDKYRIFRRLANTAAQASSRPSIAVAAVSEDAVISRHRILAAIGMAEAAMGRKYAHIDEALRAMEDVLIVFRDEELLAYNDCDNGAFLELRKYAVDFQQMMHDLAYRLPGLIRVNFSGGVHPLVAAYVIYNDAKRHRELEPQNIVDANGRFAPLVVGISPV